MKWSKRNEPSREWASAAESVFCLGRGKLSIIISVVTSASGCCEQDQCRQDHQDHLPSSLEQVNLSTRMRCGRLMRAQLILQKITKILTAVCQKADVLYQSKHNYDYIWHRPRLQILQIERGRSWKWNRGKFASYRLHGFQPKVDRLKSRLNTKLKVCFHFLILRNMAVDMSAEITDQNEQLDIITLKVRDINRTIYMSGCIQRAYWISKTFRTRANRLLLFVADLKVSIIIEKHFPIIIALKID